MTSSDGPSSHDQILAIVEDMTRAQTAEEVQKCWDKDMAWFDIWNGISRGRAAAFAHYNPQFETIENLKATILEIKVEADGNVGFAYSLQHFLAHNKAGGPPIELKFRQTDCFRRKGGKWAIVHQHLSVPVDAKTLKGDLAFES